MRAESTVTIDGIPLNIIVIDTHNWRNVVVRYNGEHKAELHVDKYVMDEETYGFLNIKTRTVKKKVSHPSLEEHIKDATREAMDTIREERDFSERVREATEAVRNMKL